MRLSKFHFWVNHLFKSVRSFIFYTWELQSKSLLTEAPWGEGGDKTFLRLCRTPI